MRTRLLAALMILLAGNAVLVSRAAQEPSAGVEEIEARMRSACRDVVDRTMTEERLEPDPLLPAMYVLMVAVDDAAPFRSIYAARFARDGVGSIRVHDPELCYATSGWSCTDRGTVELSIGAERRTRVSHHLFARGDETRVVISWKQPRGRIVDVGRSWWRESIDQLVTGRSDFVWIRVEVDERTWTDPDSRTGLTTDLVALMRAFEVRLDS